MLCYATGLKSAKPRLGSVCLCMCACVRVYMCVRVEMKGMISSANKLQGKRKEERSGTYGKRRFNILIKQLLQCKDLLHLIKNPRCKNAMTFVRQ